MAILELTPAAQDRVKALLDRDGKLTTHALRLKVVGGGCSGLQYQLGFDDRVGDADNEIEAGPVRVLVDDKSAVYVAGTTVDYVDTLQGSGFKIRNPNAKSTCGCGSSYSM
jgi:iron-sulfur cluster assembly accessory protein